MVLYEPSYEPQVYLKEKVKSATRRNPCPVCNGSGCGVNSKIVLCWRVEAGSKERVKSGAFLHFRQDIDPFYIPQVKVVMKEFVASQELISKVYDTLLNCLVLSDKHTDELKARGLTDDQIRKNGYRTTPTKVDGQVICGYLKNLYNLEGVPGFYTNELRQTIMNIKGSGVFVPYLNAAGVVQGLQIRPDRGAFKYIWFSSSGLFKGASSGTHIHFARPDVAKRKKELYITEGALKADCIAALGGVGVVAIAGVNATDFSVLSQEIKKQLPEVECVVFAFDADWKTNPHVQKALRRMSEEMQKQFQVSIEDWDIKQGKGLDDKLLKETYGKNK